MEVLIDGALYVPKAEMPPPMPLEGGEFQLYGTFEIAQSMRIEELESALKIIYTWAGVQGALVPEHVRELCAEKLGI